MHKLMEYVCGELEELERKADKGGQLSAAEIDYADKLAHPKKNLLKSEEMMGEYSGDYRGSYRGSYGDRPYGSYRDGSYRSYAQRRDSMGRYSRDGMKEQIEGLMADAPNEQIKMELRRIADMV